MTGTCFRLGIGTHDIPFMADPHLKCTCCACVCACVCASVHASVFHVRNI